MSPTIDSLLLVEHVGVETHTAAYDELHRAVAKALADFPRAKSMLGGFDTVQLQKLRRLRDAVQAIVNAAAALDEGTPSLLEGLSPALAGPTEHEHEPRSENAEV